MLDSDTKRRIDTARDILVGKVPDPKSQVDQITIALIYKFMDDIDARSEEEWGGDRTFFAGEFSRYGWAKLMSPGLGGHERLNLYAESISRMGENPGVPPLFRAIFDNAFLPYRDPETLTAFLKIIDQFNYDHSERLGDSFEYLLQVMGAQGDAGQFRTPRHIIDFIVRIVDPQKHETILDPACGTAGFLISAYKHIRAANIDEHGIPTLTPDDIKRLFANITGYDISPDMVRLSLANMYIHDFPDPHVYEYDTLTSEERWNERADVILANPPFMSPKGGIRPHNRFGVQSKRSEVLFVDYIAEHLTPGGRAGVIVPEGVIFQSQRAYTQLRKMLIEEYLAAVVSLPAGVFNPYSGVKTSILLLDTAIARKTDRIAFFKVENDGFDLGAQRRPIDANDLPSVEAELAAYLRAARAGEPMDEAHLEHCMIVDKQRIAADGEHNLSAERYRESMLLGVSTMRMSDEEYDERAKRAINLAPPPFRSVPLKEIAQIKAGNPAPQDVRYFDGGEFPFIRTSDVGQVHYSDNFIGSADKVNQTAVDELRLRLFPAGTILFPKSGASTFLNHRVLLGEPAYVSSHLACIVCDEERVLAKYAYHILRCVDARKITPDQAYPSLRLTHIGNIPIPLPPLAVQREIVEEVEGYQRVIDGARAVVESWRPRVWVDPAWEVVRVGDILQKSSDAVLPETLPGPVVYVGLENITQDTGQISGDIVTDDPSDIKSMKNVFCPGDILYGKLRPNLNKVWLADRNGICSTDIFVIRPIDGRVMSSFYAHVFRSDEFKNDVLSQIKGAQLPRVGWQSFANITVPCPPLDVQRAIVAEIESEGELVAASRELGGRMEERIWSVLMRVLP